MSTSFQLGLWLIAIGLLPGGLGWLLFSNRLRFLRRTKLTTAVVEDMTLKHLVDGHAYQPKITFTTHLGEKVELASVMMSNPPQFKVGQEVPVLYNPNNPRQARIRSFTTLWLATVIFVSTGTFLFLCGVILLLFNNN
ncbi:MAG TPA: DUF3592 domain-containing protein [Ktedonobacteraceae bacterium]